MERAVMNGITPDTPANASGVVLASLLPPLPEIGDKLKESVYVDIGASEPSTQYSLIPLPGLLLLTPLMVSIILVSTGSNVLVLLSYKPHMLFVDAQSLYLLNLAVSDLLISVVCMPLHMVSTLWCAGWPLGRLTCHLYTAVQLTLLNVTTLTLVLVALDGLLLAEEGVRCTGREARKKAYIWLSLCWILAVSVHVPETLTWDILQGHSTIPDGVCRPAFYRNTGHAIFVQLWSFFLPMLVLSIINTKLYFRLRSLSRTILTFGHYFPSKLLTTSALRRQGHQHSLSKLEQATVRSKGVKHVSQISFRKVDEFPEQEAEGISEVSDSFYMIYGRNPLKSVSACSEQLSVRSLSTGHIGKLVRAAGRRVDRSRERRSQSSNDLRDAHLSGEMDLKNAATEGVEAVMMMTSVLDSRHQAVSDAVKAAKGDREACLASQSRDVSLETPYRLRRVAIILFTLVLILVLCWLPYSVAFLVRSACPQCVHPLLYVVLVWVLYCKSCINPFLYAYNTFTFRSSFRRLLVRIVPVKRLRRMTTDRVSNERASILN